MKGKPLRNRIKYIWHKEEAPTGIQGFFLEDVRSAINHIIDKIEDAQKHFGNLDVVDKDKAIKIIKDNLPDLFSNGNMGVGNGKRKKKKVMEEG